MRSVLRALLTMLLALVVVPLVVTSAHATAEDDTFATISSDARYGPIGSRNSSWHTPTSVFQVSRPNGTDDAVHVAVYGGTSDSHADFDFEAPRGQSLSEGTYDDAVAADEMYDNHPGMLVGTSSGLGGCSAQGRFTVLDMAPDLSHFWIVYEQHCYDESPSPAVYGEIKYHEPAADPDLMAAPGQVAWPLTYLGVPAHPVAVTLVNTGDRPLEVTGATVSGSSDFSLYRNLCGTVVPGGECDVYVAYTPSSAGEQSGQLTITDSTGTGGLVVPLSGSGYPGHTFLHVHSATGDWLGKGTTQSLDPQTAEYSQSGREDHYGIEYDNDEHRWDLAFDSDEGHILAPGETFAIDQGGGAFVPQHPYMQVSTDGRGCDHVYGAFHVVDASYSGGRTTGIAITFEFRCDSPTAPPLYGSVAWHELGAPAPVPTAPLITRPTTLTSTSAPTTYTYGHPVALTGVLTDSDAQRGVTGEHVVIESRPAGSTVWQDDGATTTGANGRWTLKRSPQQTTEYRARYDGSSTYSPSTSTVVTVGSAPAVTLTADRWTGTRTTRFTLRTAVAPAHPGSVVYLERYTTKGWRTATSARLTTRTSAALFRVQYLARGTSRYRVTVPADPGHVTAHSPVVTLTVR